MQKHQAIGPTTAQGEVKCGTTVEGVTSLDTFNAANKLLVNEHTEGLLRKSWDAKVDGGPYRVVGHKDRGDAPEEPPKDSGHGGKG